MENPPPGAAPRTLVCPQCSHEILADARICPNCLVDLALLALLAERAYLDGIPDRAPLAAPAEVVIPRLGEFLVDQGHLSKSDLERALARQRERAQQGERRLLGQTLVDMKLVDRETIDRAITNQILELNAALQEANRTLEQRVAERTVELRRALERLTELNQIKANLVSNVSHELRTPLSHLRGYLELLLEGELGALTPDQTNASKVMLRATGRLEQLIEDLISFSTASREGLKLQRQPASILEMARGAIARSQDKADRAGVSLRLDIGEALPSLQADHEKLSWVLFQLVDNGIKFTPSGGSVSISANADDRRVNVAVHDTGIGIPSDRLEEIFDPFHQLDGSPTRRYAGTGLGLTLARQILAAHGSELVVESEENRGSTFRFSLPLETEAA